MVKKNLALLIVITIITVFLSVLPYAYLFLDNNKQESLSLINQFIRTDSLYARIIILQLLFPLAFTIETFLVKFPFSRAMRISFAIQSIIAGAGVFFTHFFISLHIFDYCNQNDIITYAILLFESFFVLWSLLLAIAGNNKFYLLHYFFKA